MNNVHGIARMYFWLSISTSLNSQAKATWSIGRASFQVGFGATNRHATFTSARRHVTAIYWPHAMARGRAVETCTYLYRNVFMMRAGRHSSPACRKLVMNAADALTESVTAVSTAQATIKLLPIQAGQQMVQN
jgi:hypothetical protein